MGKLEIQEYIVQCEALHMAWWWPDGKWGNRCLGGVAAVGLESDFATFTGYVTVGKLFHLSDPSFSPINSGS